MPRLSLMLPVAGAERRYRYTIVACTDIANAEWKREESGKGTLARNVEEMVTQGNSTNQTIPWRAGDGSR